jgi:hypothetical protein
MDASGPGKHPYDKYEADDAIVDEPVDENPDVSSENLDPFDPVNVGKVQLIVQMRIYDVLLAILSETNDAKAEALVELHSQGRVVGPLPILDLR